MSQNEPRYLEGKNALITGITSGLGKGIARVFAARGATVIGVARRREEGEKVAADIESGGGTCHFICGDVSVEEDCERVAEECLRHGPVDILINNAAITGDIAPIHELSTQEWDRIVNVNLRGVFMLTRPILAAMRDRKKGVILNIASINGEIAVAEMPAYNASKAGLIHFTNSIAVECAAVGVRANSIVIGAVPSAMSFQTGAAIGQSLRGKSWQPSRDYQTPFGMRANPSSDVAKALSLLCMDDASTITGAVIAIDGGVSAGLLGSQMNQLVCAQLLPENY